MVIVVCISDHWFCADCIASSNIDSFPIRNSDSLYSLTMFEAVSKSRKVTPVCPITTSEGLPAWLM